MSIHTNIHTVYTHQYHIGIHNIYTQTYMQPTNTYSIECTHKIYLYITYTCYTVASYTHDTLIRIETHTINTLNTTHNAYIPHTLHILHSHNQHTDYTHNITYTDNMHTVALTIYTNIKHTNQLHTEYHDI